jgi:transcriptional regulator with XRE-family HTH domain
LTFTIFRGSILDTNYYKKETRAMTIGERLRFLRLRNNLTQEELGNRIGVKKQTIEKYEKGLIKNIPEEKRKQIVTILGVSEPYFLGLTEIEDENLVRLWGCLNAVGRTRLLEYADDLTHNEKYIK